MRSEYSPEYFVVIKHFYHYGQEVNWNNAVCGDPWSSQQYEEVRNLLIETYPTIADTEDYVVFDLKQEASP